MRAHRRVLVITVGLAFAASLWGASAAWGDSITPMCNGQPCAATQGFWYTTGVWLTWSITPGPSSVSGCASQPFAQDAVAVASCTATWAGAYTTTINQQYTIHVEVSTPTATGTPTRPPDHNGWYTQPVAISFHGTAFSGIASCTTTRYAGPDSPTATASGSCTDNAGKTVTTASAPFAYDATPPSPGISAAAGDRVVHLRWGSADIASPLRYRIVRRPGLRGRASSVVYRGRGTSFDDGRVRNGVRYQYTITAGDQAAEVTARSIVIAPGPRLLAPARSARVSGPPLLRWTVVRGASYYNVQLYRNGKKVLSTWPTRSRLRLGRAWSFGGRRYRLRPGRYRWYVWPGYGPRNAARYGHVIGARTFIVGP